MPSDSTASQRGGDRRARRGDVVAALVDQDTNAPMIVVMAADDIHVPQEDTLVFQDRRDTRVELLPDTGHCAISH
jgi:esterase FrsA